MRIALTTESYLPYLSGVTVAVDAVARGLGARGHEVLVIAPRPAAGASRPEVGSPGPEPRHAWLPSYQLPRLAPPSYRMPLPNPLAGALGEARAFNPDLVHAHSPFVTGVFARSLARATGAPLVFTHHTRFADYGHYLGPIAGVGSRLTDAYLRRFWRACAAVIAPSQDLAEEIRSRQPDVRVEVIPTGIDVGRIRALTPVDIRQEAGWPPDAVVVALLGRLAPEKSPEIVLAAVAAGATRAPALRLLLIGGGPSEDELRARATRPDLAGRVHVTGALPRIDALARLAGADLFAFASQTETQGLVLAEALAAGVPVVAVDGPGVRESVRDGVDGVVIHSLPTDTRAVRLGAELARLASAPDDRLRLAERAAADADRFSLERRIDETEALYRELL
jgi:1,2-diacylglycerol 3-alpha-glucosyltransferase